VEAEAYMNDKQLIVKVFNQVGSDLKDQDIIAWKNIDIRKKKTVPPDGTPAEFTFELEDPLKEVKVTADPVKQGGNKALLKIVLSSTAEFDAAVKFTQKEKENKWSVKLTGITPAPEAVIEKNPPVVNVTVGEDEDPDPDLPPKPGTANT
jgi:hypothetical protein